MKLIEKANGNCPRTEEEKLQMIDKAAKAYGEFLTALGFDWEKDDHSKETPKRVSKAWVRDLAEGCFNEEPEVTAFPNDEGYSGMIIQTNIPITSMCAHHNLPFIGFAHVAYLPGVRPDDLMIGLSKLNRIVEFFAHRPNVQESLTKQIHSYLDEKLKGNRGVAVIIKSQHMCVHCRGVRHDSTMMTSELSGYFFSNEIGTRTELFSLIGK